MKKEFQTALEKIEISIRCIGDMLNCFKHDPVINEDSETNVIGFTHNLESLRIVREQCSLFMEEYALVLLSKIGT